MRNKNVTKVMAVLLSVILVLPVFSQTANAVTVSQKDSLSGNSLSKEDILISDEKNKTKESNKTNEPNETKENNEAFDFKENDHAKTSINTENQELNNLDSYMNLDYESMDAEEFDEIISSTTSEELWTILYNLPVQTREYILSLDTGLNCPAMTYEYQCTTEGDSNIYNTSLNRTWNTTYEYLKDTYGSGVIKRDTLKKAGYFTIVFQNSANPLEANYSKITLETSDTNLEKTQVIHYKITITSAREGLCLKDQDGYRNTHTNKEILGGTDNTKYLYMYLPFMFNKRCGYTYTSTVLNRNGGALCCFKNSSNYTEGSIYSNSKGNDSSQQTIYLFINVLKNTTLGGLDGQDSKPAIVMRPISYSVVYDTNGASSGTASVQSCVYDGNYVMPYGMKRLTTVKFNTNGGNPLTDQVIETPFAYWKLNTAGGEAYSQGQAFSNLANEDGAIVSAKAEWYPGQLVLPCAVRTGYDFDSWDAGKVGQSIPILNSGTLTAKWKPHSYSVKFISDGMIKGTQNMIYGIVAQLSRQKSLIFIMN